jgi:transposase
MSDHLRVLIRSCLRHLACLEEEVEELDAEIIRRMQLHPFQAALALLQTVPGIGQLSAATILAETGTDLAAFPTAEQMASWAGLCPGNRESAGIQKGRQTTHGNPYLRWCSAHGQRLVSRILSSGPASSSYRHAEVKSGPSWRWRIPC